MALKILALTTLASVASIGAKAALLRQSSEGSATIDVAVPVSPFYQNYAAQDGNPKPTTSRLFLLLPAHFDSRKAWPVLIVTATRDFGHTAPKDALYYRTAAAQGWIVLATDGTVLPKQNSVAWKLALLGAGLAAMHRDWPHSATWPVVFAGISGGAKASEWLGAALSQTHALNIRGFFLSGINDDRMPQALKSSPPSPEFLRLPIWISSGIDDPIAPPEQAQVVTASLRHSGFSNVHFSRFAGGHVVSPSDLESALKWFRSEGRF